ncbi:hypothetical protein N0V93_001824 [Gnomoniopsis smithogilvyi]|uniref:Uncharacterized protein n=1 Tax=Gnomoniopsis smithogilvyi TaxID=1191159 RepID=A0A9W8Z4A5_9PEZI|nr:hypothetical protein N0V93_001824 [Gnomoniopsis smithogilvyi]
MEVAVDHGETWDTAIAKYGFDVPGVDLLPLVNPRDSICSSRPIIASRKGDSEASDLVSPPASAGLYHRYQGPDSDITQENTGHQQHSPDVSLELSPSSPKSSDTQPPHKKRKPLPGSRRDRTLHSTAQAALSLPAIDHNRYTTVHALHLQWDNEWRQGVLQAGMDLGKTLRDAYGFGYHMEVIPLGISHKHFRERLQHFIEKEDERGVLKIVYYAGDSYLDGDRKMMLTGPRSSNRLDDIRWSNIQVVLEEAVSDVLLIMDCPYWTPMASKRYGVLEILAGSNFEIFGNSDITDCVFTKNLAKVLQERAAQTWRGPLYVADLHSQLTAVYRNVIPEGRHNEPIIKQFPAPFHMLIAGENTTRASIQLAPRSQPQLSGRRQGRRAEPEVIELHFHGEDEDRESLNEWLRLKPENVRLKTEKRYGVDGRADAFSGILSRHEKA